MYGVGIGKPHETHALRLQGQDTLGDAGAGGMGRLVEMRDDHVAVAGRSDPPFGRICPEQRVVAIERIAGDPVTEP